MSSTDSDVTVLLGAWSQGEPEALDQLVTLVYGELRRIADGQFSREPEGHTLQPTAVIHEFFLTLMNRRQVRWQNRAHFYGFAARQMRRILVSHARKKAAGKRGGDTGRLQLEEDLFPAVDTSAEILRVDDALNDLERFNPVGSQIVEMRFFGGLSRKEMAEALDISPSSVRDKWTAARAWLRRELAVPGAPGAPPG